jgi:hypothetical protein
MMRCTLSPFSRSLRNSYSAPELSRHRRESSLLQPRVDQLVRSFAAALDPAPSIVPRY